jgi:hypothetical protein
MIFHCQNKFVKYYKISTITFIQNKNLKYKDRICDRQRMNRDLTFLHFFAPQGLVKIS